MKRPGRPNEAASCRRPFVACENPPFHTGAFLHPSNGAPIVMSVSTKEKGTRAGPFFRKV